MTDTSYSDPRSTHLDDDRPHASPVTPAEDMRTVMINQISWGAVFAGVVLTLAAQLILNLLGIGIGAATLDPGQAGAESPGASALGIGAGVWFVVSGILASFLGGFAAGRLGGKPKGSTAGWHGLTAWALSTLVIFFLLTSTLGGIVGGGFSALSSTLGGAASTVGATAQTAAETAADATGSPDPFAAVQGAIEGAAGDTGELRDAAVASMRALVTGDEAQAEAAREEAAQAVSEAQGIPVDEARIQVEEYEAQYREAAEGTREQVADAADTAANTVSTGTLLGALGLLLGAVAGWFGGRTGAPDPTITARPVAGIRR